jgi:hypothetical protein
MTDGFLSTREDDRTWTVAGEQRGVYWVGEGPNALEVVYTEHASEPSRTKVRKLWEERQDKRPSPVLLIAAWPKVNPERAVLAGPTEDELSIVVRDIGQAERLAARALEEPKRAFAIQMLKAALAEVDDPLPGVRNDGLLATHELRVGVPQRRDWTAACERGERYLGLSDRELVSAMGYDIEQRADHAILRTSAGGEVRAVAVFLDRASVPMRRRRGSTSAPRSMQRCSTHGARDCGGCSPCAAPRCASTRQRHRVLRGSGGGPRRSSSSTSRCSRRATPAT